jgi:hypothetical protein
MPRVVMMIPFFGLLAVSAAARAECFCLVHPQSGDMLYGCEVRNERYLCADSRSGGKQAPPLTSDWKRVECPDHCPHPLKPVPASKQVPRGPHEEPKPEEPKPGQ